MTGNAVELIEKIDMQLKIDLQVTKGGMLRKYTTERNLDKELNYKGFIRGSAKTRGTPLNLYTASEGEFDGYKTKSYEIPTFPVYSYEVLEHKDWKTMAISKVSDYTVAFAEAMDCAEDVTIVNAIESNLDINSDDLSGNDITVEDVWRVFIQKLATAQAINSARLQLAGGSKCSTWMHVTDYAALVSVPTFMNSDYRTSLTIDGLTTQMIGGVPVETFTEYDVAQGGANVAVAPGTLYVATNGAIEFVHRPSSSDASSKYDPFNSHRILISMTKDMGAKVVYPKNIWKLTFDAQTV